MSPGGGLVPDGGGGVVPGAGSSAVVVGGGTPQVFEGEPIRYESSSTVLERRAWDLLPAGTRDWAIESAGGPIDDPVTGSRSRVWTARIDPDLNGFGGLDDPALGATYRMCVFGELGLAVAEGTTSRFEERPGATRWRSERRRVRVDPARLRVDVVESGWPNTSAVAGLDGSGPGPHSRSSSPPPSFLSRHVAAEIGNLPVETQRSLLVPFGAGAPPPQAVGVEAVRAVRQRRLVEECWVYLYNARSFAMGYAARSIPGWKPEDDLAAEPWRTAVWSGAVLPTAGSSQSGPRSQGFAQEADKA